ncbi:MAG TPA: response regulator transcription factor [Vicinamibacterales bacterium]|jgi:two-component system, OmpR family, KDP operon response regulator KdpE
MSTNILVVGDNLQAAKVVSGTLTSRGYEVRTAGNPELAFESIRARRPSLIIAELGPSGMDDLTFCRRVRDSANVPLIVVSADDGSEIAALDSGADDYLVKPLITERLLARVRAALRRSPDEPEAATMGVGAFHIDFHDHRVRVHGQPVRLTPKEFDLFVYMARHPNRVLPHKTLLGAVWGQASEEQSEYLRVFVGQLRKKLETDPANPRYLLTEPWVGYRFNPMGAPA